MFHQRKIIRNQSLGCILLAVPAIRLFIYALQPPGCDGQPVCIGYSSGLVPIAALLLIGAAVLYLTSLIEALSRCIHMKTWRWLFAIIPLGPVGILLFGLLGPKDAIPELDDWFDPTKLHKRRSG